MDTQQTAITLTVASTDGHETYALDYVLGVTDAPPAYDGFGTLTLYDTGKLEGIDRRRYVLIRPEHALWQEARYRSGLHTYDKSLEFSTEQIFSRFYSMLSLALVPEEAPEYFPENPLAPLEN